VTRAWPLALWLVLAPGPASAVEWKVDKAGQCTAEFGREDWARGLAVVRNGVLRPGWSLMGGIWFPLAECPATLVCLASTPLWIASSTVWGTIEGAWWVVSGTLEQATTAAAVIPGIRAYRSSHKAAEAGFHPLVPFLESHPATKRERCSPPSVPPPPGP
jgi:hypothetical protein